MAIAHAATRVMAGLRESRCNRGSPGPLRPPDEDAAIRRDVVDRSRVDPGLERVRHAVGPQVILQIVGTRSIQMMASVSSYPIPCAPPITRPSSLVALASTLSAVGGRDAPVARAGIACRPAASTPRRFDSSDRLIEWMAGCRPCRRRSSRRCWRPAPTRRHRRAPETISPAVHPLRALDETRRVRPGSRRLPCRLPTRPARYWLFPRPSSRGLPRLTLPTGGHA